jgi:hypothetical protein
LQLNADVKATEDSALLVDLEIFDSSFKKVHQSIVDNINVQADVQRTVPFVWNIPGNLPAGTYIVSLGIFGSGWSAMHKWHAGAAYVTVINDGPPSEEPLPLPAPGEINTIPEPASIKIVWKAVPEAASYELEVDGTVFNIVSGISYEHTGLGPDTAHSYRVRAKGAKGPGAWSEAITARTLPPAGTSTDANFQIRVKTDTKSANAMPDPGFEIKQTGSESVRLSDLTVRYYFTIDGEKPLTIDFWTTTVKSYVNLRVVKMPVPSLRADTYLEISFAPEAGNLASGSKIDVYPWFYKSDWSSFDQSNDYSYTNSSDFTISDKVTVYKAGKRVWGVEPELFDMPPFPTPIHAVSADTSVSLSWEAVEGATGYDVDIDGEIVTNIAEPAYTQRWLNPGTYHTYKIRTRSGNKIGIWSSPMTLRTTGEQVLPAPKNLKAEVSQQEIVISWNPLRETVTGYELEADGTIVDMGAGHSYTHGGLTPGSKHTYRVRAKDGSTTGLWSAAVTGYTTHVPTGRFDVSFTVDTSAERAAISPYIYGTNDVADNEDWKARRIGGNRLSTYNWENNASNAGEDYFHLSDNYIPWYYGGVPYGGNMEQPGIGIAGFHQKALNEGAYSLVTLQTAGYVARDKDGAVSAAETAPSSRWVEVKPAKNAPFSLTPDLTDNYVYMDEFVHSLVKQFGGAKSSTGIKGYEIDNEPGLWQTTHPYMHPERPGAEEVTTKGIELAKAVKKVDPDAELFGPVSYGFDEMYSMRDAEDWKTLKGNYDWYLDYYLDKFRIASLQEGTRLLGGLDVHWYPEITGGGYRITNSVSNHNLEANKARLQAPRSLWDPTYKENTWIGTWFSSFLPLIPRMQQSIDMYNQGTNIVFSEYNYGGENNVYGGIAQADVFGIFGKYGVFMGNFWKMVNDIKDATYITSALRLYENYDGNHSAFGDTKVKAETSDIENSSIYGSVYTDSDNNLHLIVLNKNNDYDMNASFELAGGTNYHSARIWAFDGSSPEITERQPVTGISGNSFTYTIPKLTACHIVLSAGSTAESAR